MNLLQTTSLHIPIIVLVILAIIILLAMLKAFLHEWWWIDFVKYADTSAINKAKEWAANSKRGELSKSLPSTEENFKYVLLYNHIRIAQIDPKALRRMKREYLDYIAGMRFAHPDLTLAKQIDEIQNNIKERHEQLTKLQGNVSRARFELTKRNLFWATSITALAALGGSILGSSLQS